MSVLCPRNDCPVERDRRAINETIAEGEKRGAKFSAECSYVLSCATCTRTVGWQRTKEGFDKEIPQHVIWGREIDAA